VIRNADEKVLITGGAGFIGRHLTRRLLDRGCEYIRIFSRDEHKHEVMDQEFDHDKRIHYILGSVRDLPTLERAMRGVDICVHASALKIIPRLEYSPWEAVSTNVYGAYNVIQAAISEGVKKVVGISSDKAVNPINVYGNTKALAERLFVRANVYTQKKTLFSMVRYGNVVNSTNSLVPCFMKQRETRILTITDNNMTRFLMMAEDAMDTIEFALANMVGGEVFVRKSPSAYITDIAKAICPECEIKIIGIRPGEKLHEALLSPYERQFTVDKDRYFIILPDPPITTNYKWAYPKPVIGQEYSSLNNPHLLGPPGVRKLLGVF